MRIKYRHAQKLHYFSSPCNIYRSNTNNLFLLKKKEINLINYYYLLIILLVVVFYLDFCHYSIV